MQYLALLSEQAAFVNSEIIPWILRLVMMGLGLSLTMADFTRVLVFPKAVSIGLVAQLVGVPLVAFIIAFLFNAPPEIAVGLVILAACPSGATANAYTFASRADVPLCITLSAITSIVTVFSIPFLIDLALDAFDQGGQMATLPLSSMLMNLITFTLLPLFLGMLVRHLFSEFSSKAVEPIRKVVLYVMMLVLLLGIVSSYQVLIDNYASVATLVVVMNLLTMVLGFGLAKLFKLPLTQVITITFEVGIQNLALAFAITFNILQRPDLAVAGLVYAVVMPATALGFVSIARKLLAKNSGQAYA